jgi:hypothetical protein
MPSDEHGPDGLVVLVDRVGETAQQSGDERDDERPRIVATFPGYGREVGKW